MVHIIWGSGEEPGASPEETPESVKMRELGRAFLSTPGHVFADANEGTEHKLEKARARFVVGVFLRSPQSFKKLLLATISSNCRKLSGLLRRRRATLRAEATRCT